MFNFNFVPPPLQEFLRGLGCRAPPPLIGANRKCRGPVFLLLAVKSRPGNFAQRQAVRETWGREEEGGARGGGVQRVFLLGGPGPDDPRLHRLLEAESGFHGDLLQWDFRDSLLNLTLKLQAFLGWAGRRCAHAAFVFSGDDDVFVNTPAMLGYLRAIDAIGGRRAAQLYAGHVIHSASPLRDARSKYYVPASFFQGGYPPYAGGGGFLFSGALLMPLIFASRALPLFPIDDVFVGMCFRALDVAPEAHPGFRTFDVRAEDRENLCVHKQLMLIHRRTPQEIQRMWRGINSPLLNC
ncbi:LOW QUALITY PROTEIN: N-acetyllactosaminide beta-1,3-N-acetylglucosaminyltransferase 2 [Menidia menidia]